MNIIKDINAKKTIYKVKRFNITSSDQKTQILLRNRPESPKSQGTCIYNSPTPVKKTAYAEINQNTQELESKSTQKGYLDIYKTHGKRQRQDFEIRDSKKFKSCFGDVVQKVIYMLDSETKESVPFNCFLEDQIIENFEGLELEQPEDDCKTTSSQIQYCKDFLNKELEAAIINA